MFGLWLLSVRLVLLHFRLCTKMKESVRWSVTNHSGDLPGASLSGRVSIIFNDVYTHLR